MEIEQVARALAAAKGAAEVASTAEREANRPLEGAHSCLFFSRGGHEGVASTLGVTRADHEVTQLLVVAHCCLCLPHSCLFVFLG